ncbi:MAG: signal peptidase II [Lachnospiraceae bacterium]|nr:signal peptidase II [Candidatus Equihabitans merdae]
MKIIRKLMPMIIIAVIIVVVDLLTKVWAERALAAGPIVLIPGVLEFSFLRNFGAAFGSLQGARFFFLIITAVFMAAVLYVTIKMPSDRNTEPYTSVWLSWQGVQ